MANRSDDVTSEMKTESDDLQVISLSQVSVHSSSSPAVSDLQVVSSSRVLAQSSSSPSAGFGPDQNLSPLASILPISTGSGPDQILAPTLLITLPVTTGTFSVFSQDSGSNRSNVLKMFERKFNRIKTESFELEKYAQDAISFWHSQCHGSVIIAGAVGFLTIAKLPCFTVEIFGGLLLLFLLGMIYPSLCAFHKLRYVDASSKRLKERLDNLRQKIINSSIAVPEEKQELESFTDEVSDFKLLIKSRHSVDLIVQIGCAVAYFLTILFIAYEVFCGDDQNPHGQNLIEQVWNILQQDQSKGAREDT